MILDSDVIINFLRKDNEITRKILALQNIEELSTTSINTFEVLRGLSKFNKIKEGREFLANLKILSFNFKASEKAAEIFEELRIKGEAIDALDLMIASIAIVNNETLMAKNTKHFERMCELKIEA